jgi:DNA-binding NarL/FixJ family response regulator
MAGILIADDHAAVRLGLELLLKDIDDSHTIKHAINGNEALQQLVAAEYDILIMDMNMPEPSGLILLEKALRLQPHLKVLVISVNPESFFAPAVFRIGAYGYINKNENDAELKKALKAIVGGDIYIPPQMRATFFNQPDNENTNVFNLLSPRELEITLLLLKGMGMQEISSVLSISSSTASTLKGRVFKKLDVTSVFELEQLARHHAVVTGQPIQPGK